MIAGHERDHVYDHQGRGRRQGRPGQRPKRSRSGSGLPGVTSLDETKREPLLRPSALSDLRSSLTALLPQVVAGVAANAAPARAADETEACSCADVALSLWRVDSISP